jgi:two-component system, LytTR family, sensor histidine kinase LytS
MKFGEKASLQIESEPGKGTKITFSIPQAEEF